jgi:TRAP-type C4-dicarboxylate transport system permease small subunit
MKLQFTDDAHLWHRMWSMRLSILAAMYSGAAGAWATIPADWIPHIPERWRIALAMVGCAIPALAALSRVIEQPNLKGRVQGGEDA